MKNRLDLLAGTLSRALGGGDARQRAAQVKRESAERSVTEGTGLAAPATTPGASIASCQDALLRVSADGRVVDVNDVTLRLLGCEKGDLEGKPFALILADEFMGAWMMHALLESGFIVGEELSFLTHDGSRVPVVCSGVVVNRADGRATEIAWVARKRLARNDLGERVRTIETALERERAERLRLQAELVTLREWRPREETENQPAAVDAETGVKDQLWAWAEEELRRVQSTAQRTRERLFRVEEELERTMRDREWAEERRRRSEEELQRVREELLRAERQVRAADSEHGAQRIRSGNGRLGLPSKTERYAPLQLPPHLPWGRGIDWSEALAGVDGDLAFLRIIAETFSADLPLLLQELRDATESGDAALVERHARTLKGAVRSLGATVAAQVAARLEAIARSGNLAEAEEAYIALQLEIERIEPAVAALRAPS